MTTALDDYLGELMGDAATASAPEAIPLPIATPMPAVPPVRPRVATMAERPVDTPEPNPLLPGHPVVRGQPDPPRQRRAEERYCSWLRFEVSGQNFAVEVLKVQEVMRVPEILALRGTAPWMLGMMNLRGQIVPVTDLALRLGLPPRERGAAARVVVLEHRGEAMGLLVDAVADVHPISAAVVEHLSGPLAGPDAAVIHGIARRDCLTLTLLHAERLLD